ncbi:hypothetical protein A3Q56_04867 [Intoshia linei]|uniref:Ig-like domain-containing protein n=1 Tax=Intoshia linei TaxID=1819745 RepID=A0A177AZT6_9BILA|nr:hypothetical protein A3Q56_04867 [Intoshia linei]
MNYNFVSQYTDSNNETFQHSIQFSPFIRIVTPKRSHIVNINTPFVILCEFHMKDINPKLNIIYESKTLTTLKYFQNNSLKYVKYVKNDSLVEDSGIYSCEASLNHVKLTREIEVIVYNKFIWAWIILANILQIMGVVLCVYIYKVKYMKNRKCKKSSSVCLNNYAVKDSVVNL